MQLSDKIDFDFNVKITVDSDGELITVSYPDNEPTGSAPDTSTGGAPDNSTGSAPNTSCDSPTVSGSSVFTPVAMHETYDVVIVPMNARCVEVRIQSDEPVAIAKVEGSSGLIWVNYGLRNSYLEECETLC